MSTYYTERNRKADHAKVLAQLPKSWQARAPWRCCLSRMPPRYTPRWFLEWHDFFWIWRCKDCAQLEARLIVVPMDHIARVVVAAALHQPPDVNVIHVTVNMRLRRSNSSRH